MPHDPEYSLIGIFHLLYHINYVKNITVTQIHFVRKVLVCILNSLIMKITKELYIVTFVMPLPSSAVVFHYELNILLKKAPKQF
jgi:hypothetical protein